MAPRFTGREHEMRELERLYRKGGFQMVVLYGRRRVGKTTLAFEFAKGKPTLAFTAKVQSDALNLADFSRRIYERFDLPQAGAFATWDDAFAFVAKQAAGEHLVFIFDEFPYAAAKNPGLVSTLQVAVDHQFGATNIFFILTGSNQGFMEEKVLGEAAADGSSRALGEKNPLFGRRTAQIHLAPFGYLEAARMLPNTPPERLVEYYACFGGTPYYLSMIDEDDTLQDNVERLFFTKEGLLYEEPMMLLRQELREPAMYSSIMDAVAAGANRPQEIADKVGDDRTVVGRYLGTLQSMGLVARRVPFGENVRTSRKGVYRLCEPCFAFWYRFVQGSVDSIEQNAGELAAREALRPDELATYVGHWFEEICAAWVVARAKAGELPIAPVQFGTWWGTNPATRERDDIDVLAANARRGQLLLGECKWRNQFDESAALAKLATRRDLVGIYRDVWFALFSKRPARQATRVAHAQDNVLFVDAEELYRER